MFQMYIKLLSRQTRLRRKILLKKWPRKKIWNEKKIELVLSIHVTCKLIGYASNIKTATVYKLLATTIDFVITKLRTAKATKKNMMYRQKYSKKLNVLILYKLELREYHRHFSNSFRKPIKQENTITRHPDP